MKALTMALLLTFTQGVWSQDFTIKPYSILTPDQKLIVKFKLKHPTQIKISGTQNDNGVADYESGKLYQISIGKKDCDKSYHVKFHIADKRVYQNKFSAYPCEDDRPFVFGFYTDTQIKYDYGIQDHLAVAKVIRSLIDERPSFLLHGGDVVQNGSKNEEWIQFFKMGQLYNGKIPFIADMGNHEYYDAKKRKAEKNFMNYFRDVNNSPSIQQVYDFPQFKLIILNSNFQKLNRSQEKAQIKWVEKHLIEASNTKTPVIVSSHHSPYCSRTLCQPWYWQSHARKLRKNYVKLFEKYNVVKYFITGHTHMYERSRKKGINYLIGGPAGGKEVSGGRNNPYMIVTDEKAHSYSLFKIQNQLLSLTSYNEHGHIIDTSIIDFKVD